MSVGAIGAQASYQLAMPIGQRLDPEAQQAVVNAQADLLQATRTMDLPATVANAVSDGTGVDLYL